MARATALCGGSRVDADGAAIVMEGNAHVVPPNAFPKMPKLTPAAPAALLLSVLAALACAESTAPTSASTLPTVRRVVVVSVDGLRGDALSRMPALAALTAHAAWTDSMRTVVPSLTVPGHVSMFTGRDVTKLGITTNTLDASSGLALALNGATSFFQWTKSAGGTSAALVGTSILPAADVEQAKTFFGIDEVVSVGLDLAALREQALALVNRPSPPTLTFVHIPTVDFAGHDHGWIVGDGNESLRAEYVAAASDADAVIGDLIAALRPAIESGDVALIVTADHGGGHGEGCAPEVPAIREHCTAHPGDVTIPFVLDARDVAPGRLGGHPTIMQVAPTVARLLKLTPPRAVAAPVL